MAGRYPPAEHQLPRRSFSQIVPPPALSSSWPYPDPTRSTSSAVREDSSASSMSSSEDDLAVYEDKDWNEKSALVEEGQQLDRGAATRGGHGRRRRILTLFLVLLLSLLCITFFLSQLISSFSGGRHTFRGAGLQPITLEHVQNGTFWAHRESLRWLAEAGDGVYAYKRDDGSIVLEDLRTNSTRTLVDGAKVVDSRGQKLDWSRFRVSADLKYILFDTEYTKQWRHSSHANFWLHTLSSSTTRPLLPPSTSSPEHHSPPHTSLATFSPSAHHVAYVHSNDLFILPGPSSPNSDEHDHRSALRLTVTGSPTTFHGTPDWVYEEEVFSSDSALWWSPDGASLAWLSFDEEEVPEYEFPVYNESPYKAGGEPYPSKVVMRYPKPGYSNPLVTLSVFSLSRYLASDDSSPRPTLNASAPTLDPRIEAATSRLVFSNPFPAEDVIVQEVAWVSSVELMVRATDRTGGKERVALFVVPGDGEGMNRTIKGQVVRETDWAKKDGGWVEPGQSIVGISSTIALHSPHTDTAAPIPDYPSGYLDIVPTKPGFNHIAFFSPPSSEEPVYLTSGEWEVDGGIQAIDVARGLIYFIAARPSTQRHLYSIPLPSDSSLASLRSGTEPEEPTLLTDAKESKDGYHTVSFSPFGAFYVLGYEGPNIPWQVMKKVGDAKYDYVLANNTALAKTESKFQKAEISYGTVRTAGVELNTMELRPPLMDLSGRTKYPVLFQVYGGPSSQMVSTQFSRDFHHYLVTSLGYVVVKVDPRGTGFKGRSFRAPVRGRLGQLEAEDVVSAAREWTEKPYIDERRVGIWGWSYGGFLTNKVVETNSSVFTLGMSVAPVTDWRYYDSVYTERYMSTPQLNPVGYRNSSVREMYGFKHVDFALAHGSGDDNVHYLNTAVLLDRFTSAKVRGFRFRMFTDSDHSIQMRGAYWELMQWLSDFLVEKFGEGGRTKQRWKLRDWDESRKHAEERKKR